LLPNINYQIWFKVCRPLKHKYNLSTNCLLVLNGAYVLHQANKKDFTIKTLQLFTSYYNSIKIKSYITVLISHNFIIESGMYKGHQLYCISSIGLQVIQELNDSYNKELVLFCSKYNIEL
jgi:hypothetical protein